MLHDNFCVCTIISCWRCTHQASPTSTHIHRATKKERHVFLQVTHYMVYFAKPLDDPASCRFG